MSDRALLIQASEAAGEIAKRHFKKDPEVWEKGDQGPVTEADIAIDVMLRDRLMTARPDYGWISEESASHAQGAARVFVIDPIDGTRAFVDGQPDFTHSLAIIENGVTIAAAIHQPIRDRTWSAALGEGARLGGTPIAPSGRQSLEGAEVLAAKPTMRPDLWNTDPGVTRTFRSSLAYRLALIAEGRFDAMLTLRDCWEWDIAAGALICAEAGAAVTDRQGAPLRFGNASHKVPGVIAGSPAIHAGLLDRLAPSR